MYKPDVTKHLRAESLNEEKLKEGNEHSNRMKVIVCAEALHADSCSLTALDAHAA